MSNRAKRVWTVTEAKGHFKEIVDSALETGPQTITRKGAKSVVMVSAREWEATTDPQEHRGTYKPKGSLADFFAASPLRGSASKITRTRGRSRKVDL